MAFRLLVVPFERVAADAALPSWPFLWRWGLDVFRLFVVIIVIEVRDLGCTRSDSAARVVMNGSVYPWVLRVPTNVGSVEVGAVGCCGSRAVQCSARVRVRVFTCACVRARACVRAYT